MSVLHVAAGNTDYVSLCVLCGRSFEPEYGVGRPRSKCYECVPSSRDPRTHRVKMMRRLIKLLEKEHRRKSRAETKMLRHIIRGSATFDVEKLKAQEILARDPRSICACGRDYLTLSLTLRHECTNPLPNPKVRDHDRYRFLF